MALALLSIFKFGILLMPAMVVLTQPIRNKRELGYVVLVLCYLVFIVNEIAFFAFLESSHFYHASIDSIIVSIAALILTGTHKAEPAARNKNMLFFALLITVLTGSSIAFFTNNYNPKMLVVVVLLFTGAINSFLLIKVLEDDAIPYLKIMLFWIVSHVALFFPNEYLNFALTTVFFGALTLQTGRSILKQNMHVLQEKELLVKARDVVVSMLTDISLSTKNITSLEYTLIRILETIIDSLSVEGAAIYTLERSSQGTVILQYSQSSGIFWTIHTNTRRHTDTATFDREDLKNRSFGIGEGIVGMVAETQEPVEVDRNRDRHKMEVFGLHPAKIRNILAVPLKVKNQLLGVVVVQNRKNVPSFNNQEKELLQALADQAAIAINNVRMYAELAQADRLRQEMTIATNIQRQLLPTSLPTAPHLRISAFIEPAKEVGGDYYDFLETREKDCINLAIGDVSGKGLPAGMIMIIARTTLHIVARGKNDVKEVVTRFAQEMYPRMQHGQFMTFIYLNWNDATRTLSYAGAGHEHILWYHKKTGQAEKIKTGGIAVGLVEDPDTYISKHVLHTQPGDVFVLYTDGVTDARDKNDDMFTLQRLQSSLERHATIGEAKTINKNILQDVYEFMGDSEQYDDITLLVLSVLH